MGFVILSFLSAPLVEVGELLAILMGELDRWFILVCANGCSCSFD